MAGLIDRMIRAARLEPALYEEVESDPAATRQAAVVVALSSVGAAVGELAKEGRMGLFAGLIGAFLGWLIWAYLCFVVGTKALPEAGTRSNLGELLRTTGFAATPGILRAFTGFPGIGVVIGALVSLWMIAAFVVAVRQALDYQSTGRAVAVVAIGFAIQLGFALIVGLVVFGTGAALFGGHGGMHH